MSIKKLKLNTNCYFCRSSLLFIIAAVFAQQAQAFPFQVIDARTAALGGTGVAAAARNATYYNPSLLSTYVEDLDAIFLGPVYGESNIDPDDVENNINDLQAGVGDSASLLTKLTNTTYQNTRINSLTFIIPSETVGGAATITNTEYHTAKPDIDPALGVSTSTLAHKAIDLTEIGASAGSLFDLSDYGLGEMQLGLTAKIMLFESYSYTEPLATSSFGLKANEATNNSLINFNIGLVKELGIWKLGFVVKNIFSDSIKYGNSEDRFKIKPQARAGMAYQSRRTLFEFDIDLTKNEEIGFASETAFASVGWEYQLFGKTYVRAGLRQNMVGDKLTTGSVGFGIGLWGVIFDVSTMVSEDEQALFANLGYEI